jgi:hypothetical protein
MQQLTDELLPAAMEELGMRSFTLEDGAKVEVRQLYGASIPIPRKAEAFEWLRNQGFDDIIKNSVTCVFGRGEDDKASSFRDLAAEKGFEPPTERRCPRLHTEGLGSRAGRSWG